MTLIMLNAGAHMERSRIYKPCLGSTQNLRLLQAPSCIAEVHALLLF